MSHPGPARESGIPRWIRLALLALTIGAIGVSLAASASASVRVSLGPIRFTSQSPVRSLIVAALSSVALFAAGRRFAGWRRASLTLLAVVAILAFLLPHGDSAFSVGDIALIELNTLYAIRWEQLLGPYSRYSWHHPGPLAFYWLAPFYWAGRFSTYGLYTGALVANIVSVSLLLWIAVRNVGRNFALPVALGAMLALYTTRVPGILTSIWNPHTPVLPLLALVGLTGASVAGEPILLPLALVLGSFVVQTHVGFGIVAAILCGVTLAAVLRTDWLRGGGGAALRRRLVIATFTLQALWLLPIAEQIAHKPGNMTLLMQFFTNSDPRQAVTLAWQVWGTMVAGVFEPEFALATGGHIGVPDTWWWPLLGTATVVGLIPAGVIAWRQGQSLIFGIVIASFLTSIAGFYSILNIREFIADHQVFWLSAVGIVNVAAIGAAAASYGCARVSDRVGRIIGRSAAVACVVYVAYVGGWPMLTRRVDFPRSTDSARVSRLVQSLVQNQPDIENVRVGLKLGEGMWGIGAGVMVQLLRRDLSVTVAPEMIWMFGENVRMNGREELLIIVSKEPEHVELAKRPGNKTVAQAGDLFIDAVSLRDYPIYRP